MAAEKWSEQPLITTLAAEDQFLVIQNSTGLNKRITSANAFTAYPVTKYVATQVNKTDATGSAVSDLSFSLLVSKKYRFSFKFFLNTDTTGGFKFSLGGGTVVYDTAFIYEVKAFDANAAASPKSAITNSLTNSFSNSSSSKYIVEYDGVISVTTAGTFIPLFAQLTANGTSSILIGSYGTISIVS